MRRNLNILFVLLALSVGSFAQKAQKADVTETNLRRHITYLASDELGGRRTGEPGADMAADYVAKQFATAKLKPGGTMVNGKQGFLQPFTFTPVRDPHAGMGIDLGPAKEYRGANVIGVLDGHDPLLKNEVIVIGAHYDHLGHGGAGSLAAN